LQQLNPSLKRGIGGTMSKEVLKAEIRQPPTHEKTVLSREDKAAIRKGAASLAASRTARFKAEAGTRKSK
jgi:hypothetical protein